MCVLRMYIAVAAPGCWRPCNVHYDDVASTGVGAPVHKHGHTAIQRHARQSTALKRQGKHTITLKKQCLRPYQATSSHLLQVCKAGAADAHGAGVHRAGRHTEGAITAGTHTAGTTTAGAHNAGLQQLCV